MGYERVQPRLPLGARALGDGERRGGGGVPLGQARVRPNGHHGGVLHGAAEQVEIGKQILKPEITLEVQGFSNQVVSSSSES